MVIDPGKWQPGINCERELREFSGVMKLFCTLMEL